MTAADATGDGGLIAIDQTEARLSELWRQAAEGQRSDQPVARVRLLNLVAHSDTAEGEARAESVAALLAERHPGRMIVVAVDDRLPGNRPMAEVSIRCTFSVGQRREVCSELITLRVPGGGRRFAPSAVSTLLVSDLPVAVWWTGALRPEDPIFRDLTDEEADIVLIDSGAGDTAALAALVRWATAGHHHAALHDLAWARLLPWRQVVAELFDQPAHRALLTRLHTVEITSAGEAVTAEALLFGGWLASRLGWQPPAARTERTGSGVTYRLDGGAVNLSFRAEHGGAPAGRMVDVRLLAGDGPEAHEFQAHRGRDITAVHSHIIAPGEPRTERGVGLLERPDEHLLLDLLDARAADPLYPMVLARAVELATALGG